MREEPLAPIHRRALLSAVNYALGRPDFSREECLRYMALALKADEGESYGRCVDWMASSGGAGPADAARWAQEAFYALRPGALAAVAERYPQVFESPTRQGMELGRSGLAMAVGSERADAAASIAATLAAIPGGARAIARGVDGGVQAFAASFEISSPWGSGGVEEGLARLAAIRARCERALLSATAEEPQRSRGAMSL